MKILIIFLTFITLSHQMDQHLSQITFETNVKFDDDELKKRLTKAQYTTAVRGHTEFPKNGKYYKHNKEGIYNCIICNEPLFSSEHKIDPKGIFRKGYAAFTEPVGKLHQSKAEQALRWITDIIRCENCGCYLGRCGETKNPETKNIEKYYYLNSVSLNFVPSSKVNL